MAFIHEMKFGMPSGKAMLSVLMFAASLALAEATNVTFTVEGITYSNVVVSTVTPISVSFRYSKGAASISLEKLPPELQKRFGYDPQKAADYLKRQAEAAKLAAEKAEQERQQLAAKRLADEERRNAERAGAANQQVEEGAKRAPCRSFIATFIKQPDGWFHMGAYWRVTAETDAAGQWHDADRVIYLMPAVNLAYSDRSTFRAKYLGDDLHDTGSGVKQRIERWSLCED